MEEQTNRCKKVFAAGNTGVGFHSFFEYIAGPEIESVYVLKGGPGTGKSTLMKRVAQAAAKRGYFIEMHHCASDVDSLDALVIPGLGAAFIDGMRPHIYDPPYPGALGQILNLGEFWHSSGIRAHKQAIVAAGDEGSRLFQSAFRYLKAAKEIHGNWADKIQRVQDKSCFNRQKKSLLKTVDFNNQTAGDDPGRLRHLFAAAIGPVGPISYLDSLTGPKTEVILLKGPPGSGKSELLKDWAKTALELGWDVEAYHNPIDPRKMQHVLCPGLDIFIAAQTELFPYEAVDPCEIIDLNQSLDQKRLKQYRTELELDRQTFLQLVSTAVQMIYQARETHLEVEHFYVKHMDFTALDAMCTELICDIMHDTD